jgi:filamentous hemagglutinin family protein
LACSLHVALLHALPPTASVNKDTTRTREKAKDQGPELSKVKLLQSSLLFSRISGRPNRSLSGAAFLVSGVSLLALCAAAYPGIALAGGAVPSGGQFSAGAGSIASTANGLNITQSSSRGIINWQSFSIGQGQSVQISNGAGATLNRVTGGNLSTIAGSLTSTGSVYLVNPAGVIVMPTGQVVTTGSFVASTRDISDTSFLAGGTLEFTGGSSGAVVNQGSITSSGGDVVLIGQSVSNSGQISAPNGTAALAAGDDVLLRQGGDQAVLINAGTGGVTNTGNIAAAQAQLAAADGNVYALATNNGGVIRATGTATKDGHVYLTSSDGDVTVGGTVSAANVDGSGGTIAATGGSAAGSVTVSGALNAKATGKTAKGGYITVTASSVTVAGTALIAADGGGAGGTVLIGGDRHGGSTPSQDFSPTPVANAQTTTVAAGAFISATGGLGGGSGSGGNVVIWSNQSTSFAGAISATGGAAGGNGGFVEVSGAQVLGFTGTVDTSAPLGLTGTLLLDPENVTIYGANDNSVPALSGLASGETQAGGVFTPSAVNSYILNTTIDSALATNNVTINTGSLTDGVAGTGNIHFGTNNGVNGSNAAPIFWSSANTLTLNAVGQIDMPGGTPGSNTANPAPDAGVLVDSLGSGGIVFNASGNGVPPSTTSSAAAIISIQADIKANGGAISFNALNPDFEVEVGNGISVSNVSNANGAGAISITADYVRMGSLGSAFSGALDTTGNVYIQPFSAGAVTVGNNSSTTGNPGGSNYNSANNIALIDQRSISNITAANLVIGNTSTTSMTLETPTGHEATITAPNVGNVELLTGASGSVTQDAHTPISVDSGAGGLAVSTGGAISLPDANLIGSTALLAGGNIALSGQTVATASGTLTIGTVNGISGITTTGAGATTTLINSGTVTQATGTGQAITTPNLVLEGGGAFTLDNLANMVSNIAGGVGSLSLTDGSALATAPLSDDLASPTTFSGISASGAVTIVGDGSVTIGSGAPIATTAGNVMIEDGSAAGSTVTAGSGFVNDDGATAFNVTGGGTWRVYSQDPRDNTLGGLTSANYSFVQYDAPSTYGAPGAATTFTNANAALNASASGNGFLYGVAPTITATVTTTFTKQYDATTTLPGSGSIPVSYGAPVVTVGGSAVTNLGVGGTADTVTLNQAATLSLPAANFYPDKNVGTYTVGVPGVSLQSATDANGVTVYGYNVTPSAAGAATITPKPLTVIGLTTTNKVYDGTTADPLGGAASLESTEAPGSGSGTDGAPYSGDSVSLSGTPVGTFSQKNVGNGISVAVSGLTLGNNANGDYTLSNLTGLMADITPAPVTVSGSRYYDGMTDAPGAILTVSGEISGDPALTVTGTGSVASPNASPTPQNLLTSSGAVTGLTLSGTGASNYSLVSGTLTINPEPLTITASNQSRSYGPTGGTLVLGAGETTDYTTSGLVNSETIGSVTLTGTGAATAAATNAGTLTGAITPSAATGGTFNPSNYAISYLNGDVTITPALLTVTGTKTYDATTGFATNQLTVTGGVNGQTVTLTAGTGASSSPNAGTYAGSTLTGLATGVAGGTGSDLASNYQLPALGTLTISPAPVTVSGARNYDGMTDAPGAILTVSGEIPGDPALSVTGAGSVASPNASLTPQSLLTSSGVVAGLSLSGTGAGNYSIISGALTINPAPLTITATTQTKIYDGGTTSTSMPTLTSGTLEGSDTLTNLTQAYNSRNVLGTNGSTLSVTSYTLSDPGNYTVTTLTALGTITPEAVTVTAVPTSKGYDGTTSSPGTPGVTSGTIYGPDTGTFTQTYNTPNVGTGLTLTPTGSISDGNGGNNYTVTYAPVNTGVITAEPLTITAVTQTKVYDGTTVSTNTPELTAGTLAGGDTLTNLTQAYNSKNVLGTNGSTLSVTSYTLSDPGNYTVTTLTAPGTITPRPIVVIGTRVYDAATDAASGILTITNVVAGDTVALGSGAGIIAAKNVGPEAVTGAGTLALIDNSAGDYTLTGLTGTVTVTPLPVTVTGTRVYDGATDASSAILTIPGDLDGGNLTVSGSGTLVGKNVGPETIAALGSLTLGGAASGNYTLTGGTVTITPELLVITAVPSTETYDGVTTSSGTPIITSGALQGMDTGAFIQTYGSKNAGTGIVLTPSGTVADGDGGKDYTITYVPISTGIINPRPVVLTGTRPFDGSTDAPAPILTVANLVGGDTVSVGGGYGLLVNPAVGNERLASFGTLTLGGPSAGNYTFIGGGGIVLVTPGIAIPFPPVNETISGIGGTPFTDAVYDGGILGIFPRQNGVVTGLIATIDGQAVSSDTVLACTMITYGTVCIQNGLPPQPGFGMMRTN